MTASAVAAGPPLAEALRGLAGGRNVVPAGGGAVLVLGPFDPSDPRYRVVPGGIYGAALAVAVEAVEPTDDPVTLDAQALVGARLDQSSWLLDATLDRLRHRESAGRPLAAHTHLRLRLSEAAVCLAEAAAARHVPAATTYAHRRVSRADAILAELHGGSSVLTNSPGHVARFSAMLALAFAGVM